MNEKKLRIAWISTLVSAFVLIVAMVLVWKFRFYDPVLSELDKTQQNYTKEKGNADKLDSSLKGALLAQQRLGLAAGELQYFRARYRSLPMDLTESAVVGQGPRNATFIRYLNEYASGYGLAAVSQLKRAADESGVIINSQISVDKPPQNPEEVVAPPSGLLKPPTQALSVTVTGTFGSILQFFQIINRSEILMVIGNVKMDSPSAGGNGNAATGNDSTGNNSRGGASTGSVFTGGTSVPITASFTITPYLLVSGPSATQAAIPGIENARPGAAAAATIPAAGTGFEGGDASRGATQPIAPASTSPPAN